MAKTYSINECFYSPQGEGAHAGTMNVFLRFAGCNLQCTVEVEGFNCDTDFRKGDRMTAAEVVKLVKGVDLSEAGCGRVICTGGEPTLQLDYELCAALNDEGYLVAVETNGTRKIPAGVDWVSCSPKVGSHVVLTRADEVRVVVADGVEPDARGIVADYYYVSPHFDAPPVDEMKRGWQRNYPSLPVASSFAWALEWCKLNPKWAISTQQHKLWGVR